MVEAVSVSKPGDGWFVPNCDRVSTFLDGRNAEERRSVRVTAFGGEREEEEDLNVMQAVNNWLEGAVSGSQAVDPFGVPNPSCSAARSEPLDLRPDALLPEIGDRESSLRRDRIGFQDPAGFLPGAYDGGRFFSRRVAASRAVVPTNSEPNQDFFNDFQLPFPPAERPLPPRLPPGRRLLQRGVRRPRLRPSKRLRLRRPEPRARL